MVLVQVVQLELFLVLVVQYVCQVAGEDLVECPVPTDIIIAGLYYVVMEVITVAAQVGDTILVVQLVVVLYVLLHRATCINSLVLMLVQKKVPLYLQQPAHIHGSLLEV
jgi:hypothetical protein